jgi:putative transcriptional regulator
MPIVRYSLEEIRQLKGRVDRAKLDAATEEDIARWAKEDGSETGDLSGFVATWPMDVAAVREKTGLSQERFAAAFGLNVHTLRNWEQGRRVPDGPARMLLLAIDREPATMMRLLGTEAA